MKIIMFGHKRIPSREGGVEVVVEELSSRMAELGHEVVCYNRKGHHVSGAQFDAAKTEWWNGVRLKTAWTLDKKGLAALTSSFCAAVCSIFSRADVVHIHAEGPAFMCWIPKLFGKRVVVTVHGLNWKFPKWQKGFGASFILMGEKMAVRFADELIVLSRNIQQYFWDTYKRKTTWIPNGVSEPELLEPEEITERFGLEKDQYILFLGRLVPEKGIEYLIEAFRNVKTVKKLVIAGGSSEADEYLRQIRQMAVEDERILFTGFVRGKTLHELYSNAYFYVLPSVVEGMPLTLLEAMSYGNCCLVSDIPECMEVIDDKAIVFEKGDVQDLEQKLQKLCDDSQLVEAYKMDAARYILSKYSWDDVTRKTLEVYRRN